MNHKKYYLIIDIINLLLKFLISVSIIGMSITLFTKDTTLVYKSFLLLPIPVISYFAGRLLKHLWSFLSVHLLMAVICALLPSNLFVQVIYAFYVVLLTLFELQVRLTPERLQKINTSIYFIPLFFLMYLMDDYIGLSNLNQLPFILVIVFVILYLLNMYLINFEKYFRNHSNITNIPMGQIVSTNNTLILFFGGFCIFVMILFTRLPMKSLLSALSKIILMILRAIASIIFKDGKETPIEDITSNNGNTDQAFPIDGGVTSPIWEFIQNLILGLVLLVIIAAFIALLAYGLYKLYQRFYGSKINNFRDSTEFISPFEKRTGVERNFSKAFKKRFNNRFGQSNSDKIRKLFFKGVIASVTDNDHPELLTPAKLSQMILLSKETGINQKNNPDTVTQLTEYYEKARYSNKECTKEDVQLVKEILH